MRKWITALLILALLGSMPLVCYAQENLSLSDGKLTAQEDVVYLTVTLNVPVTGDSMGISVSGGEQDLELLPKNCKWDTDGDLKDFDLKNRGVFAVQTPTEFSGKVCTLALKSKHPNLFDTNITCTLIVQNGNNIVASYTATAKVERECTHSYPSRWTYLNEALHEKECALCQNPLSASHNWNQGDIVKDTDDPAKQWKVYTCADCAGTKKTAYTGVGSSNPSLPEVSEPPESQPTQSQPTPPTTPSKPDKPSRPNKPESSSKPGGSSSGNSGNSNDSSNSGSSGSSGGSGNSGSTNNQNNNAQSAHPTTPSVIPATTQENVSETTIPMVVENHGLEDTPVTENPVTTVSAPTEDQSASTEGTAGDSSGIVALMILLAAAVAAALAALLYLGKKRKLF